MRIAVLADVHGNLPALRAVLAELDADPVDAIVVAGDQVAGPFARATLELLESRPEAVQFVSGNGEREALSADPEDALGPGAPSTAAWAARDLGERLATLREWPICLSLDGVCFCHGSPRRDDEVITRATPDAIIAEILADTGEPLVVGGVPHLRVTSYALAQAREEMAATGFPALDDFLEGSPFDPLDPEWVTALFEHGAGRGEPPGDRWSAAGRIDDRG